MKIKLAGVALLVPLLFVQAQKPKEITIGQLMKKYQKDTFSSKVDERRKGFEGFYLFSRNISNTVTNLSSGLLDPDPQIRDYAVQALANIGPRAMLAAPQLVRMVEKEKDESLRIKAIRALGEVFFESDRLDDDDIDAIVALARALRNDPSQTVRFQACVSLGRIGPCGHDAINDLIDMALRKESDPKMREQARFAILPLASPRRADCVPRLLVLFRKGELDEPMQFTVLCALGQIAAKEEEVVPLLVGILKSNDASKKRLREAAAYGLCAMRAKAKNAVPALVEAFEGSLKANDGNSLNLRQNILDGLHKFGPEARIAVPALAFALEGSLKGNDEHSLELRRNIFNVLGRLGPAAIGAIPTLRKIADDPSNAPEIRSRAKKTLKTIEQSK